MTIAQLIQRSLAGDESATQALVTGYQHEVLHLTHSILNDPAEAEEAAQEAFITAVDFFVIISRRGIFQDLAVQHHHQWLQEKT